MDDRLFNQIEKFKETLSLEQKVMFNYLLLDLLDLANTNLNKDHDIETKVQQMIDEEFRKRERARMERFFQNLPTPENIMPQNPDSLYTSNLNNYTKRVEIGGTLFPDCKRKTNLF